MQVQTAPGLVLGYGSYSKPTDRGRYRVCWGKDDPSTPIEQAPPLVEFATIKFDGDDEPRTLTLDKSINGNRPDVYAQVSATLEVVPKTIDGIYSKRGDEYVPTTRKSDKWRAVAFDVLVAAPKELKAAA